MGTTTNSIAARAGLQVPSLYEYFPNKFAILRALWDRQQSRQLRFIANAFESHTPETSLHEVLEAFAELFQSTTGLAALFDAIRAAPQLQALREQARSATADFFATFLRESLGHPKERSMAMATVVVESASAVLVRAANLETGERKTVLRELSTLLELYFQSAPPDTPTHSRKPKKQSFVAS